MPAARRRHRDFSAIFGRLFDRLPVRIWTSDLHHRILRKKIYHIRAYDFGAQFSFNKMAELREKKTDRYHISAKVDDQVQWTAAIEVCPAEESSQLIKIGRAGRRARVGVYARARGSVRARACLTGVRSYPDCSLWPALLQQMTTATKFSRKFKSVDNSFETDLQFWAFDFIEATTRLRRVSASWCHHGRLTAHDHKKKIP